MQTPPGSLDGIEILRDLAPEDRRRLALRCLWADHPPESLIVGHRDESRQVYFLVRGKARAILHSPAGRDVTFRDLQEGEMFGEFAAIDGEPRSASVEALQRCLVAVMPPELFWQMLREHPEVTAALLKRLTRQVRAMSERIYEFATLAVKNRIHAELLRLAAGGTRPDGSAVISPPPTHAEIASRIATHREAVSRELAQLAHEGLVERRRGALVIRDLARLRRMVAAVSEG